MLFQTTRYNNNRLIGQSVDSYATFPTITQDVGESDFQSIRESRSFWQLCNISLDATPNTLRSITKINPNDELLFYDSGSVTKWNVPASAITEEIVRISPEMIKSVLPFGRVSAGPYVIAEQRATNDDNNYASIGGGDRSFLDIDLGEGNEAIVTKIYFRSQQSFVYTISGSNDEIIYEKLTHTSSHTIDGFLNLINDNSYRFYRVDFSYGSTARIYKFLLYAKSSVVDTTLITQGSTPSNVFKRGDILINDGSGDTILKKMNSKYTFKDNGVSVTNYLYEDAVHQDMLITGRNIDSKAKFNSPGNSLGSLDLQIYREN